MRFWQRLLSARLDCGCFGPWLVGWLDGWLDDGWLVASFSQRSTNKLARRNLLHQRCQMPLQLPHLLYKLIEGVRFQSILLWYNHFSCLPTFHSSLHSSQSIRLSDFPHNVLTHPLVGWLFQVVPARVLHRGPALRLQYVGAAGASCPGTQRRLVESRWLLSPVGHTIFHGVQPFEWTTIAVGQVSASRLYSG